MSEPQARIVLRPGGDWELEVAERDLSSDEWKTIIWGKSVADLVCPLESLIESLREIHKTINPLLNPLLRQTTKETPKQGKSKCQ